MYDMKVKLNELVPNPKREERDKALKKACQEFESIFTHELLKSMRRTIDKSELFHGGQGEEIYQSMLDQELAKTMAGGGNNSLAGVLYRQFKQRDLIEGPREDGLNRPIGDPERDRPLWPLDGMISSGFGWRKDPINGRDRFHYGIDFAAQEGVLVRAALPGKVLKSHFQEGYGNVVLVEHGEGFTSLYAHNRGNLVKEGDWVEEGTPLAKVGSSGRSTGPHLHFEVKRNGNHLDPHEFLRIEPEKT